MFCISRGLPQSILANPGTLFLTEIEHYQILPKSTFAYHPVIDATHFKIL